MKRNRKKKGFTLIELIVVIAILGILAAIAIPRYSGMQASAKVKAEASTAAQIVSAARIQESDLDSGSIVTAETSASSVILAKYMTVPVTSTTYPDYKLNGGGASPYVVTWTSLANGYGNQTYTENATSNPVTK